MTANRKLAAILAADVAGYSRLMADDEPATLRTLHDFRHLFRERIEAHGGRLIDTAGDSVLAEFPSPVEAVACATELQQQLARRNAQLAEHRRMLFRIGVNLGDVIEEDGGLYGDGVNVAARLQALADPGGVCVSGTVFDQVEGKLPMSFKFVGEQQVKNIPKPVRTYRLETDGSKRPPVGRVRAVWMAALVAVAVGLTIAALWYGIRLDRTGDPAPVSKERANLFEAGDRPRLAVLPLDNFSADSDDEYFSDGMTEELISRLSRLSGMDVIARTSVMQYKGTRKSIADIGRELNVDAVLEGSVRKAAGKVRITVQLIDVPSQAHLWSEDYDREFKDLFDTQSDIAGRIAQALHVRLGGTQSTSPARNAHADLEAYDFYLKGRYHWSKTSPDALKKSIDYFKQGIARSPGDARTWAALAEAYAWLGWNSFVPPTESFPNAKAAAEKALALDPQLAEAHAALGLVRFLFEWDWPGAEQSYRQAIELSPSYASAHLWYGVWFKAMARNEEAVVQLRRAFELDPLFLIANAELGWVAYFGRRFDEAERNCRRTLEMDPTFLFALVCLQNTLVMKKDPEAIELGKKLVELVPGDAYMLSTLGWAYGVLGQKEEANAVLSRLREMDSKGDIPPAALYYVYMGLGDRDATFREMEVAYRERWADVVWTKAAPEYDWIRGDPRFAAFLRKMRFEP